ncbi:alpha/beta hydrolase [Bradyrhizobium sp.]|uniref:alpha/beta fold hydrolase n=1 Tax=Bradyrhizobium sp. TaxID=376 RepID=UPI00260B5228|nr:alpha/beta hydrolase [Bradyrhizobium sp.]
MGVKFVDVNGVKIAYRVRGDGPPLVLVMGYRLSSVAWPRAFIEQLAHQFLVVTLDNRGTGFSDKPVRGYAIANMARDVCAVLDDLGLVQVNMLGYSMGGAIAQEFVRQFPDRVASLILCATMVGGPRAKYATASVVSVMRDLDGLSAEQAARRIWKVTYSPGYLERHQDLAEEQMLREVALPTPLHAADLQFQAFAEFDGSRALANIRCPTLILTGDLDELIPPENAMAMARIIPAARLVIFRGCGHRVLWEDTHKCVEAIAAFVGSGGYVIPLMPEKREVNRTYRPTASDTVASAIGFLSTWPLTAMDAGYELMAEARRSLLQANTSYFGDGKPIILVPQIFASKLTVLPLSIWLKALGYRPVAVDLVPDLDAAGSSLSQAIQEAARRVGRKAVVITFPFGISRMLRTFESHKEHISDVVVIGAALDLQISGVRTHCIQGWFAMQPMMDLRRLLRGIDLELIELSDLIIGEGSVVSNRVQGVDELELEMSEDADD